LVFLVEEARAVFHNEGHYVSSADDADELSVIEYGDPAEVVVNEAVTDFKQGCTPVKADHILRHIILDETWFCVWVVEQLEDVFFRDDAEEIHIVVDDGQTGDVLFDHQCDGLVDGGVFVDGCHAVMYGPASQDRRGTQRLGFLLKKCERFSSM